MPATTPHQPEPQRRQILPWTDADKRFFALRESGWTGWIDQDGYKVVDLDQWDSDHKPKESTFSWTEPSHEERRQGLIFHLAMSDTRDTPADRLEEYDLTEELIDYVRKIVKPYLSNTRRNARRHAHELGYDN